MLITIDTNDAGSPAAAARFTTTAPEPASTAGDAGAGPGSGENTPAEALAAAAGFDAGGPPSWLTAAIAAAELATLGAFGFGPAPDMAGATPSSDVADAGSGPADDPVH